MTRKGGKAGEMSLYLLFGCQQPQVLEAWRRDGEPNSRPYEANCLFMVVRGPWTHSCSWIISLLGASVDIVALPILLRIPSQGHSILYLPCQLYTFTAFFYGLGQGSLGQLSGSHISFDLQSLLFGVPLSTFHGSWSTAKDGLTLPPPQTHQTKEPSGPVDTAGSCWLLSDISRSVSVFLCTPPRSHFPELPSLALFERASVSLQFPPLRNELASSLLSSSPSPFVWFQWGPFHLT